MQKKRNLAESALWPMGDTGSDADQLQKMLAESASREDPGADPVQRAIEAMFLRDGLTPPNWQSDGSVLID
jgi:hypothetical protein